MIQISNFFLRTSLVKKGFGDPLVTHTGRSISLPTCSLVKGVSLFECQILRKANLYETCTVPNNCQTGILAPIRDPLLGRNVHFAHGKILPMNSENYDKWYRSLPIHKMFLDGKESENHYLAPDNLQPISPLYILIGMLIVNLLMMTETNYGIVMHTIF